MIFYTKRSNILDGWIYEIFKINEIDNYYIKFYIKTL